MVPCGKGRFNPSEGAASDEACQPCGAGSAAAEEGSASCEPCPGGSYASTRGAVECKPCPLGHHCAEGSVQPMPCDAGSLGARANLTSQADCAAACHLQLYNFVAGSL